MSGASDINKDESGLISTKELAKLLAYPSVSALHQARCRGLFPIEMMNIPHRKGLFALRGAVNDYLKTLKESSMKPG